MTPDSLGCKKMNREDTKDLPATPEGAEEEKEEGCGAAKAIVSLRESGWRVTHSLRGKAPCWLGLLGWWGLQDSVTEKLRTKEIPAT